MDSHVGVPVALIFNIFHLSLLHATIGVVAPGVDLCHILIVVKAVAGPLDDVGRSTWAFIGLRAIPVYCRCVDSWTGVDQRPFQSEACVFPLELKGACCLLLVSCCCTLPG